MLRLAVLVFSLFSFGFPVCTSWNVFASLFLSFTFNLVDHLFFFPALARSFSTVLKAERKPRIKTLEEQHGGQESELMAQQEADFQKRSDALRQQLRQDEEAKEKDLLSHEQQLVMNRHTDMFQTGALVCWKFACSLTHHIPMYDQASGT